MLPLDLQDPVQLPLPAPQPILTSPRVLEVIVKALLVLFLCRCVEHAGEVGMAEDEADAVEVMDVLLLVGVEVHLLGVQVHQLRILPLSLAVLLEGEEVAVQDGRYQEEESDEELVEAVSRGKLHDHLEVFDLRLEDVSVVSWAVEVLLFCLEEGLLPQAEHFLD